MSPWTLPRLGSFFVVVLSAAVGCSNYSDQLHRAEQHYANARYEAAQVNLDDLEISLGELSPVERVRYDLVRGMTYLRLEQRPNARHWLALAREDGAAEAGTLTDAQRATIERTLTDLDPLNPHSDSPAPTPAGGATPTPAAATPPPALSR